MNDTQDNTEQYVCKQYLKLEFQNSIVQQQILIINSFMKSALLTSSSNFGKYLPNNSIYPAQGPLDECDLPPSTCLSSINLKQNYVHESPFTNCRFDIPGNRLYLVDQRGMLIHLNLNDNSFSTLKNCRVRDFTIDGNNSLGLLYVTPTSQLFRVSFENKKPSKITNLNMSRTLAFERNYLRQMILALDYKLLFVCQLTKAGPTKIRSLKAGYNEVFTNACFTSNNRFIVLIMKNVEIRIVQIMNLKTVHQIRLPFEVQKIKIQVSYDSKRIAIYGECNIIFFITLSDDNANFTYELIQIPFLKSISKLKYTYQNDILFLGNDQILYGILPEQLDRAIPLFNQQYQLRMMSFDISLDCTQIAIVSNRIVFQLKMKQSLKQVLKEQQQYKQLQYRINGFEGEKQTKIQNNMQQIRENVSGQQMQSNNYQYEDEDYSEEDSSDRQRDEESVIRLDNIRYSNSLPKFTESHAPMNPIILQMEGLQKAQKSQINQIFTHLSTRYRDVCIGQSNNIAQFVVRLHQVLKGNYLNCLGLLDLIFNNISRELQKLQHYSMILCPELVSIVQRRFNLNFLEFYRSLISNLGMNYFKDKKQWAQAINFITANHQATETLPLFIIALLKNLASLISCQQNTQDKWEVLINPSLLSNYPSIDLKFDGIVHCLEKMSQDERHKIIFSSKKRQEENHHMIQMYTKVPHEITNPIIAVQQKQIVSNLKLEQLILKQQEIKRQLLKLKKQK